MAMYDWNHDGKKDLADDFLEYQIYKDITGQNYEPFYNSVQYKKDWVELRPRNKS